MPKQPALPRLSHTLKKKVTRREAFPAEMDAVVPWTRLLALIEPHYPKAGPKGGRPPMPLETMLRVHFLQQWYALSDPMAEESLYDSEAMRHFAGIELGDDRIPDETTILNFRHLLERHGLTEALFAAVNAHLADKGITLRSGTLVDATIIDAPFCATIDPLDQSLDARIRQSPRRAPANRRCRRRRRATTGISG
jgi:IS5 family transposase